MMDLWTLNIFILSKFCILGDLQLCSEYFFLKSENGRRFSVCFSISGLKIRLLTFLLWFERKKRTILRKKSHNLREFYTKTEKNKNINEFLCWNLLIFTIIYMTFWYFFICSIKPIHWLFLPPERVRF